MKKIFFFITAIIFAAVVSAQPLTGIKTIPGTAPAGYPTIATAIADLNLLGVGSGGVTFEIAAGYTETITAPLSVTATGTAANPVIFRKSGAGVNPVITAYPGGTGTPVTAVQDGIWNLVGSDYITIDGIDLTDPNTSNPETMEYGYGFFKVNTTNGCQYNIIKNCTITLNRLNNVAGTGPSMDGSRAIFLSNSLVSAQTTALSPTTAAGANSYNSFYSNIIQNCNTGIAFSGFAASTPFTAGDTGNDIGGTTPSTGNTIINFGGGGGVAPAAGIRTRSQWGLNISNNLVNNNNGSGTNHLTTLRGIFAESGTSASITISNNNVTIQGGATTSSVYGIDNGTGTTAASNLVTISGNQVTGSYSTATSGIFYAIQNTASAATVRFENNVISGISVPGTGALYGIATGSPANMIIQNNQILNLTKTGNGIIYGIQITAGTVTCSSNILDGLTRSAATSTAAIYGINSASSAGLENFTSNTIRNLSASGTATLNGINLSGSNSNKKVTANQIYSFTVTGGGVVYAINFGAGSTDTISANQIHDLTITGATSGSIHGIRVTAGTLNVINDNVMHTFSNAGGTSGVIYGISVQGGTTNKLTGNQLYNLATGSTNPSLYGIYITSGAINSCINNIISDLRTTAANAGIPLVGIYASGGTANNLFYNSIFLNGTSSGASFGSAAFYASVSTQLDMRNNILVNLTTPKGTGIAAAYRRSTTDLTNYSVNSNTNLFYAGATEDATHTVFYNGTSTYTLANFQLLVGPYREAISFREQPPFTNILTTPYDLHLLTTVGTACESGGMQVILPPAIDTDADHEIRQGNTGYAGTGSAPDVGADEFDGIPSFNCIAPVPGNTYTSSDTICLGEQVTLTLQNTIPGTGITYQWQGASEIAGPYSDIAGAIFPSLTLSPEQPQYYRCKVICHAGGETDYSVPVRVAFPNIVSSVTPGSRCATGTVTLEATVSNGTLNWYTNSSGGVAIGSGSPFVTPSITSSTPFYAAADIIAVMGPVIGAGASTGTGTENPFYHVYGGKKSQYLVRASELTTAGLSAGNITSLSLEVVTPAGTYNSFGVSIGHTALTAMTSTLQTGLTPVYSVASLTPVAGINTFPFTTPFTWDGVSNIIIETCWSNNNTGGSTTSVKYDAPGFTAQGYYRANSIAPATFCATTTGTSTTTSRPKMYLNYSPPCYGPRTAVMATVTAPPDLLITAGRTICSTTIHQIQVLSPTANFDGYTWSPVTNLYTDAACTIPYASMQNTPVVYFSQTTAGTYTYTCNATNSPDGCYNAAQTTVTVLPSNAEVQALPAMICNSGSTLLTLLPSSGFSTAQFQWQESADSVTFTNIPGASTGTYTTPVLTATHHYRLVISDPEGFVCGQPGITIPVVIPMVTGTTPGSRCGTGTVMLAASHDNGGVINWYADSIGGISIGSGSPFITPVISSATTFYAAHQSAAEGSATPPGEGTFNSNNSQSNPFYGSYANTHNQYLIRAGELTALGFFAGNITSLSFPVVSGTTPLNDFSIRIGQTTVNQLNTFIAENFVQVYHSDTQVPVIGNNVFNFDYPFTWDGVSNLLIEICHGNPASVSTIFSNNVSVTTYFFATIHINHTVATTGTNVCSDYTSSATIISSRPKFTFNFSGCESARVGVTATLTPPPPFNAVASPSEICAGMPSTLIASSPSPDYYYSWMPGELLGDTLQVYPSNTTVYVVSAHDPFNGCAATDTVVVTVLPTPDSFSIEPFNPTILPDSIVPLTATGVNPYTTWSPWTNLFSDPSGLVPYYGEPLVTVYARPDTTTTYNATATDTTSGCTTQAWVMVTVIQNCISPTQLHADSITHNSVIVSWYYPTPLPAMGFQYELRTSGAPGSGYDGLYDLGTVYDTTFSIYWLSAQTTYHFYVRAVCGEGFFGAWSADLPFTTLMEPVGVAAETIAVSCYGNSDGAIYAYPYSGTPPYSLLWNTGDTTTYIAGLTTGYYSLTVTDASGDTASGTWLVGTPDSLIISFLTQNPSCFGSNNGYVIAYPSGGTFPYSMVWNTGATGYNLSELSPGTYTLTVTDSYGCQAVDSVVMVQPDPIMVDATVINESCPGAMDGSISLIITGGNSSYPYLYYLYFWSNGASSENISGLSADTYSVTVMDNFGCNGYGSFIVAEASAVCDSTFVTGNLTGVSCYDATQVITVAGNGQTFVVESGASATFIAGAKIRFLTGTQVLPGGYMLGRIAPSGPFCAPTKLTEVAHSAEIPMVSAGKQHLLLYPNPVSGNFRLLFREIPEQGTVSVEVFNLNGERIRTFPWDSADQEFETTGLPVGLYMVRVKTNNWVEMIKLVKNR